MLFGVLQVRNWDWVVLGWGKSGLGRRLGLEIRIGRRPGIPSSNCALSLDGSVF